MSLAMVYASLMMTVYIQSRMISCKLVIRNSCQEKCGDITIPYPFGIGESCALDTPFIINCSHTYNPPKAFLASNHTTLDVVNISLDGYLHKHTYVSFFCSRNNDTQFYARSNTGVFFFSTRNKFTVVGCNTYAVLKGRTIHGYASGCMSSCPYESLVINGSCSGIGCCQTSIPPSLNSFNINITNYDNHYKKVLDFNPCSYAFIADADYFNFTTNALRHMPSMVPTVIDWVIGNGNLSCKDAVKNVTSYACKADHSECRDYYDGKGYRCYCSSGYAGNPYVPSACADVDECKNSSLNNCSHKCHNLIGTYTCSCPKWYDGDGRKGGHGCSLNSNKLILVLVGDGILLILIAVGILILYNYRRQRMETKLKQNFFKKNGGFILLDKLSQNESGSNMTIGIFSSEELKKATNDFNESTVCGRGGFGTVYRGQLSNGTIVAIKKSKIVDQDQVELFINEITILSQINHRNVVRFLGCCLETPVPLLVYEFITNGTLSDHIHNDYRPKLPWKIRFKIIAETASVLAYLHTDHSPQIIHRDIKPTNILLADDYTVKVSDFGASRLNPKNESEMCTVVRGTLGYLDPEYLLTSQLTEKSDVYSFGVVIVELLTGLKVVSFERPEEDRNLVIYLLSLTNEDEIFTILDKAMVREDNLEEIKQVLRIAKMCIKVNGEERPTMKDISMELEGLLKDFKHQSNKGETSFEQSYKNDSGEMTSNSYGHGIQMTGYSGSLSDSSFKVNSGR